EIAEADFREDFQQFRQLAASDENDFSPCLAQPLEGGQSRFVDTPVKSESPVVVCRQKQIAHENTSRHGKQPSCLAMTGANRMPNCRRLFCPVSLEFQGILGMRGIFSSIFLMVS